MKAKKIINWIVLITICIALIPMCVCLWVIALIDKMIACVYPLTFDFYKEAIEHFRKEILEDKTID